MSDQVNASPQVPNGPRPAAIDRRKLVRTSALIAAATAGAAAAQTWSTSAAQAAVGDPVTVGGSFIAPGSTTKLALTGSATVPTLTLANPIGPSLVLTKVNRSSDDLQLPIGGLASDQDGLLTGATNETGELVSTYIATGSDLSLLPTPVATTPVRLLDTRSPSTRAGVVGSSPSPYDTAGRLNAGAYLDVSVDAADQDFTLDAAFLNITVTGSTRGGYLTVAPPGDRPGVSSLNFVKDQTIANAAFIGLAVVSGSFVVRVWSTAPTHVIIDLTGAVLRSVPGPTANRDTRLKATRSMLRTRPSRRHAIVLGQLRHR